MRTSIQTKALAVVAMLACVYPVMLLAQMAIDPTFDPMPYTGWLATWGSLVAIVAMVLSLLSAIVDAFTLSRD